MFELPDDLEKPISVDESIIENLSAESYSNLEKIENALPLVRGLESSDTEMDELASLAIESYKDLQNLGMQVESRFCGEILGVASAMLSHAITARTAKINKKLKTIELQLKKASLDQKLASKNEEIEATPLGEGQSFDRNALLKIIASKNSD